MASKEEVVILYLEGDIDLKSSTEVRETLEKSIKKSPKKILIDFKNVAYMDSSGLATIIEAKQKVNVYNGKLVLCNLQKRVKAIFEISRLIDFFAIYDDQKMAISEL